MATTAQSPFCTWVCFNLFKKPCCLSFVATDVKLDVMDAERSMTSTTKTSPVWLSAVLSGKECRIRERRPFKVFRAGLSIATELKFCLPSPCRLESFTTDVSEILPGNRGQWLDTYSSSVLFASVLAHMYSPLSMLTLDYVQPPSPFFLSLHLCICIFWEAWWTLSQNCTQTLSKLNCSQKRVWYSILFIHVRCSINWETMDAFLIFHWLVKWQPVQVRSGQVKLAT